MSTPVLEVHDLKKHFPIHGGFFGGVTAKVYAVDGISFSIAKGETLSLVGESGCGKSTVGKAILRLFGLTGGQVVLDGTRIDDMPAGTLRPLRRRIQVVFQDPYSSLNPRMRVRDILAEPIRNFGLAKTKAELDERLGQLMDRVRLPRDAMGRWPHEFSGGQRQRIGIARALATKRDLFSAPKHPYTEALLSAVPVPMPGAQRERVILKGDVPSPINPPKGCRFHTRCPYAFDRCRVDEPLLKITEAGHWAACHLHDRPAAENPMAGAKGADLIAAH